VGVFALGLGLYLGWQGLEGLHNTVLAVGQVSAFAQYAR